MVMPVIGQVVGNYEIEAEIGGGGMARVYRVRHTLLDTHHALKVLEPQYRAQPEARERFLDEAKIQAKHLDHAGIVKVTNIVATTDVAALVMELIEGPSLEQYIENQHQPPSRDQFLSIALPILEAVGHAHNHGIIHRDIKPANILLQPSAGGYTPKVTDFGIAKVEDKLGKKKSTHADARLGTLAYMSPEQIRRAKNVTARSDVFSIGAMLYELATGRIAFDADNEFDTMQKIVTGEFVDVTDQLATVDPTVAAAISRALEPDPNHRFDSCEDFATALQGGNVPAAGAKRSVAANTVASPGGSRRWTMFAAFAAIIVLGAGVAVYMGTRPQDEGSKSPPPIDAGVKIVDKAGSPGPTRRVAPPPIDAPWPDASPPDAPPPAPCAGNWLSSDGLTVKIQSSDTLCGTYAFRSGRATCKGPLQSCVLSPGSMKASFKCKYKGLASKLDGIINFSCATGTTATADITMKGAGTDPWTFRKVE
jgi:serine/threonine-protein kinase